MQVAGARIVITGGERGLGRASSDPEFEAVGHGLAVRIDAVVDTAGLRL